MITSRALEECNGGADWVCAVVPLPTIQGDVWMGLRGKSRVPACLAFELKRMLQDV